MSNLLEPFAPILLIPTSAIIALCLVAGIGPHVVTRIGLTRLAVGIGVVATLSFAFVASEGATVIADTSWSVVWFLGVSALSCGVPVGIAAGTLAFGRRVGLHHAATAGLSCVLGLTFVPLIFHWWMAVLGV